MLLPVEAGPSSKRERARVRPCDGHGRGLASATNGEGDALVKATLRPAEDPWDRAGYLELSLRRLGGPVRSGAVGHKGKWSEVGQLFRETQRSSRRGSLAKT
eukprot:scaffold4760_cov113-Isochrysis_galbana.AAC.11